MIDLHCHSTASDGLLVPSEVVRAAAEAGLTAIALTDHDTTAGLPDAQATGESLGVRVVGGCEFSVGVEWGEMHLLGYFIPHDDPGIEAFLVHARSDRDRRGHDMVTRLASLGVLIGFDEVARAAAGGAIGRPHVARALKTAGHVRTVQQAFDKYIGRGRPAYVEKQLPTLREVADLVHARGGIVSAAHLKSFGTLANITALQADGLDAVETRHPSHDGETVANITDIALRLGLGRTGGSDWHGEVDTVGTHAQLGSQDVPNEWLDELEVRRPTATVKH